jgi:hypothetical protein
LTVIFRPVTLLIQSIVTNLAAASTTLPTNVGTMEAVTTIAVDITTQAGVFSPVVGADVKCWAPNDAPSYHRRRP